MIFFLISATVNPPEFWFVPPTAVSMILQRSSENGCGPLQCCSLKVTRLLLLDWLCSTFTLQTYIATTSKTAVQGQKSSWRKIIYIATPSLTTLTFTNISHCKWTLLYFLRTQSSSGTKIVVDTRHTITLDLYMQSLICISVASPTLLWHLHPQSAAPASKSFDLLEYQKPSPSL